MRNNRTHKHNRALRKEEAEERRQIASYSKSVFAVCSVKGLHLTCVMFRKLYQGDSFSNKIGKVKILFRERVKSRSSDFIYTFCH